MKQHIYIELYRKAFITLTELIEASLTTSLDQDTSAPVAKDEDCRQMVSKGRVLPLICKREKYSYYIGKNREKEMSTRKKGKQGRKTKGQALTSTSKRTVFVCIVYVY